MLFLNSLTNSNYKVVEIAEENAHCEKCKGTNDLCSDEVNRYVEANGNCNFHYDAKLASAEDKIALDVARQIFAHIRDTLMSSDTMPEWHKMVCREWFGIANASKEVRGVSIYQPYQKVGDQFLLRNLNPIIATMRPARKMKCSVCRGNEEIFEEGNCRHAQFDDYNRVDIPENHTKCRMITKVSNILQKASNCIFTVEENKTISYKNLSSAILKGREYKQLVLDMYHYINQLAIGNDAADMQHCPMCGDNKYTMENEMYLCVNEKCVDEDGYASEMMVGYPNLPHINRIYCDVKAPLSIFEMQQSVDPETTELIRVVS